MLFCLFNSITEAAVEIITPLKDVDALEKDTVSFSCVLSKLNRTDGKWTYNDEEISVSEKFTISTDGATQTLTIANVSLTDKGKYSYTIENVSTSATLHVGGRSYCRKFTFSWFK